MSHDLLSFSPNIVSFVLGASGHLFTLVVWALFSEMESHNYPSSVIMYL